MREFFLSAHVGQIIVSGWIFFASIYIIFGGINWLLTRYLLPAFNIGHLLDPRPIASGQIKRELMLSSLSIFLFGLGVVVPWAFLQLGWANLAIQPSLIQICLEILVLALWNEIHFYINHRLLHTRWLRRFHLAHHHSVVTTPWATYSFHPVEALMLGNVILLPMLVHDFSTVALLSLPIMSLIFNNIGHSNYNFRPKGKGPWRESSRRHHLHHAAFNGNFGFMFGFMDYFFSTKLPDDSADAQINKWRERNR